MAPDATYVNILATALDEGSGVASLTISGHRLCPARCPALTGPLYSLDSDSARRHGLPPSASASASASASVTVPGEPGAYTFTIQSVRGAPHHSSV